MNLFLGCLLFPAEHIQKRLVDLFHNLSSIIGFGALRSPSVLQGTYAALSPGIPAYFQGTRRLKCLDAPLPIHKGNISRVTSNIH
jgi:hypothetical protein